MCNDCKARRELARQALYRAKVGEAAVHVAKGLAEAAGLKPKTGAKELSRNVKPSKAREAGSE